MAKCDKNNRGASSCSWPLARSLVDQLKYSRRTRRPPPPPLRLDQEWPNEQRPRKSCRKHDPMALVVGVSFSSGVENISVKSESLQTVAIRCVTNSSRLPLPALTGVLPDSNPESVLEDLVAADRYRLLGMKRLCQSMLRISADNCLQVWCSLHAARTGNLVVKSFRLPLEINLSFVSRRPWHGIVRSVYLKTVSAHGMKKSISCTFLVDILDDIPEEKSNERAT